MLSKNAKCHADIIFYICAKKGKCELQKKNYPIIPLVFYFRNGRRTAQTAIHNDMIFNLKMNLQLPLIFAKWQN